MKLRKRTWTDAKGKRHTAFFMDYVDPKTGQRERPVITGITDRPTAERIAARRYEDLCRLAGLGQEAGPTTAQKALTIDRLLELDSKRPNAAKRTAYMELTRHKRIKSILGASTAVLALSYADLVDYQRTRSTQGCGPRGINGEIGTLRAAINRAVDLELIPHAPCKFPAKLPEKQKKRRALTLTELHKLLEAVRTLPTGKETAAFLTVLAYTGLRPGELYALTWGDYDTQRKTITLHSPKRGNSTTIRSRVIPCVPAVSKILDQRRKLSSGMADLIFGKVPDKRLPSSKAKNGRGVAYGDVFYGDHRIAKKVRAAAKRAGLSNPEQVTPYVLRHSFGTNYPGDIAELQELMGHADIRTTMIYRQARSEPKAKALKKMAAAHERRKVKANMKEQPGK